MIAFNRHSDLAGRHAFLSASKYHWINYTDEKFDLYFRTQMQAQRGTDLHALASELIRLGVFLPRNEKTINKYVNDAIGFKMIPEQVLAFSPWSFGTCDAISFKKGVLRIHDLKTGMTKTSFKQLMVYAALFCLEYEIRPGEIQIELRIYQNDEVMVYEPEIDEIVHIMGQIQKFDRRINEIRQEDM